MSPSSSGSVSMYSIECSKSISSAFVRKLSLLKSWTASSYSPSPSSSGNCSENHFMLSIRVVKPFWPRRTILKPLPPQVIWASTMLSHIQSLPFRSNRRCHISLGSFLHLSISTIASCVGIMALAILVDSVLPVKITPGTFFFAIAFSSLFGAERTLSMRSANHFSDIIFFISAQLFTCGFMPGFIFPSLSLKGW